MQHGDRVRELFDEQSRRWSGKYGQDGPLSYRPGLFIRALREKTSPGASVLDFGCGSGNIAFAVAEAGFRACGVDVSAAMIEQARHNFGTAAHFAKVSAGEALPLETASMDAVIASSVLEYVPDLRSCLVELARVTKEGGHLFFTVPNARHRWRLFERLESRLLYFHHLLGQRFQRRAEYLALSVHRYPVDAWGEILIECGWKLEEATELDKPLLFLKATK
jgi:ubiquinone/menaquinone biosynthesis C-methylase UbiE